VGILFIYDTMENVEINALIKNRWSPRELTGGKVTETQVNALFEAARWAASWRNSQPWRFIYATPREAAWDQLFGCLMEANQQWVKTASLLILTVVQKEDTAHGVKLGYSWHDLGLAMGNMTYQAMSMGLYLHNMAGFSKEKAVETFAIPDLFEPVTMIAVGTIAPSTQPPAERIRRPLEKIIFNGSWDEMI